MKRSSGEYEETSSVPLQNAPGEADAETSLLISKRLDEKVSIEDAFGCYRENVVNLLCESFLPVFKEVSEPLWNNSIFGYAKRAYYFYDQKSGVFEFYIPTAPNGENFMQHCRIVVKTVPKCSPKRFRDESRSLRSMITSPMGILDSELIFIVSPETVKDEQGKLPRGFCHNPHKGYMSYYIPAKTPGRALELILQLVWNHIYKRLKAFWEDLKLPMWGMDKLLRGAYKVGKNVLAWLIANRFSVTIVTILENFVALCRFLWSKIKAIRNLKKIQQSLKGLKRQLRWLSMHIREGRFLKEIKSFMKVLDQKIMSKVEAESKRNCSYIIYRNRRVFKQLYTEPYERFKDHPEDQEKREKSTSFIHGFSF